MRRRDMAKTKTDAAREGPHNLAEFLRSVGGSYRQALERLRQAVDILGEGQRMLERWSPPLTSEAQERAPQPKPRRTLAQLSDPPIEWVAVSGQPHRPPSFPYRSQTDPLPLRIYCLGKFRVCRGDRSIETWHSNKAKGILKLLLIHQGRPLPKDVLIEAFWGDSSPQSASNSVSVAIHELRQTLSTLYEGDDGPKYILYEGGNYFINHRVPLWVDFEEFEVRWRAGRALDRSGRFREAIKEYMTAQSLYKGDFLEEDLYEEWSLIKREGLLDIYLGLLGKIIYFHLKLDDYETCIEFSQKILAKDPCREDAYQNLITCYSKLGHRSRALRWYRLCEETLLRELDCAVSPETKALYDSLTRGDGG